MSLSIALNNALTGLNVNQQALAVLSQNIANANTAGYSRKIINQSAQFVSGLGAGVRIEDITRKIDTFLQRAVQDQTASLGKASTLSNYYDRIQVLTGSPGAGNTLSVAVQNYFNNMQSLAEAPESGSARFNAINGGVALAQQMSTLAAGLEDLRYQADRDIKQSVDEINTNLRDLFNINAAVVANRSLGRTPADLEDRRDSLIAKIANEMNIVANYRSDGSVSISTSGGISLLDDNLYQIEYTSAPSASSFISDTLLSPMRVYPIMPDGSRGSSYLDLVTSAPSSQATTVLTGGSIKALLDLRDREIPDVLSQLDTLAAKVRDEVNAIHNSGSGFPAATKLTGTRLVSGQDLHEWTGTARIVVLDSNGRPVSSGYSDDLYGKPPLDLDLSFLDSGVGSGKPNVQTIIDEINQYYGTPQNRVTLGNLNNIQLVSDTSRLPGNAQELSFDFDLQNLSAGAAGFFVTGIQVLDDSGTDITSVTSTRPSVTLDGTSTFQTTNDSQIVTINATDHGLAEGDRIYLSDPGVAINGIPSAEFEGYFTITNVTDNSFEIAVTSRATSTGTVNVASQTAIPAYLQSEAGTQQRTRDSGLITADISSNINSNYYTIKVTMGVDDGTNVEQSVVTYRVFNNNSNLLNRRYSAEAATLDGTIVPPASTQALLRAKLVDAQGNELPKTNGVYNSDVKGYLVLAAANGYSVVIDDLDSSENGLVVGDTTDAGTGRGFSHFFELNNFFQSNSPSATGDTLKGSALNMAVMQRLVATPSLVSMGGLTLGRQPTNPNAAPNYTYERNVGDNSLAQRMAGLASVALNFASAGSLAASVQSIGSYTGEVLGFSAAQANLAELTKENITVTLEGFQQRSDAVSGVNLDEELANTVIYQNAYTASARIVTVSSELFQTLLDSVR